jgi:hypothetical protein
MTLTSVRSRLNRGSWKGFMTSLLVHLLLILLACWIVLESPLSVKSHTEPDIFVTASGSSNSVTSADI